MIYRYINREGFSPFSNFKMQAFQKSTDTGSIASYLNKNKNKNKMQFQWSNSTPQFNFNYSPDQPVGYNARLSTDVANEQMELDAYEEGQKYGQQFGQIANMGLDIASQLMHNHQMKTQQKEQNFQNFKTQLESPNGNQNFANQMDFGISYRVKAFNNDVTNNQNNFFNQSLQNPILNQGFRMNDYFQNPSQYNISTQTQSTPTINTSTTVPQNTTTSQGVLPYLSKTFEGSIKPIDIKTPQAPQKTTNAQKIQTGAQYAGYAGVGLSALGSITGNEDIAKAGTYVGTTGNVVGSFLQNGKVNLQGGAGALGSVVGSVLGTSDNAVVRAAGQLAGSTTSIIDSVKAIKTANTAIKAGKTAKVGSDIAKAAKAAQATKLANVTNLAGLGLSIADTALFGNQTPSEYAGKKGGLTQGLDIAYDAIAAGIAFVPVIGTAASAIMAANKFLGHGIKAMGGGTDGMTTTDAILGSSFLQATPLGMINGFGGRSTTAWTKDDDVYARVGGSYAGSNALADDAVPYAGKKFGLFSSSERRRRERQIQEVIRQEKILRQIGDNAERYKTLRQTMQGVNSQALNNVLNGGYDNTITFSKQGGLFETRLNRAKRIIIETHKTIIIEPIEESKSSKETTNIIPEGALHANLNHMNTPDITKKGIPVVDNNGEQQAEIERDEIIFRLELTQRLEQLYKDGSDKAAIIAGKLLTKEILHNTEDRTGLLEQFKQGGEIQIAQEGIKIENELTDVPDDRSMLKEWINQKILERTQSAIQKAISRKEPYMFKNPNWMNCIATATDNYGVPVCLRNKDFMENPGNWGFEEIQFGDNTDSLPDGVIIQDFNKPKDSKTPGHSIMLVGRTETGAPIYSYSSGRSLKEDMHNQTTNYHFYRWDSKTKPKAYRYIGTPNERKQWEEEFYKQYPQIKSQQEIESHKQGGSFNIIPEGALHARKNNMEGAGEDFTHKGIPVIDNDGNQQAEIELNEIIFRLEVTKQLESMKKDYEDSNKDEIAIEAGKLLVKEILNNTIDRTGLIEIIDGNN